MNLQLNRVVSDITGVTGMRIIRTILSGERDPERLAALKDPRAKRSVAEIAAVLHGDYRAEHLFVLQQEVHLYDVYREQIQQCDQQIEQCLSQFESRPESNAPLLPRPKGRKPSRNAPPSDLRSHLYRISGVNFTQIDGLEALMVQTILSEIGLDPTRFPSATRKVNNRAVTAFRIAAHSLATRKLTSESGHPHR